MLRIAPHSLPARMLAGIMAGSLLGLGALAPTPSSAFAMHGKVCEVTDTEFLGTLTNPTTVTTDSYPGTNPADTVNALSAKQFGTSKIAILVRDDDYADGLSSARLAGLFDAPILLNASDSLTASAKAALQGLQTKHVVIAGGSQAISAQVEQSVRDLGITTERLSGATRFHTALAIATKELGTKTPQTVFFVEGANADPKRGWPDAVNISAVAANLTAPILPVTKDAIPEGIEAQWATWAKAGAKAVVVGGRASVSDSVVATIQQHTKTPVVRLAGSDRVATSNEAVRYGKQHAGLSMSTLYLVPDSSYVYGLALGAVGAHTNNAVQMMNTTHEHRPVLYKLAKERQGVKHVTLVGPFSPEVGSLVNRAVTGRTIIDDKTEQAILSTKDTDKLTALLTNPNPVTAYTHRYQMVNDSGAQRTEYDEAVSGLNSHARSCDYPIKPLEPPTITIYNHPLRTSYNKWGDHDWYVQIRHDIGQHLVPPFTQPTTVASVAAQVYEGEPVYVVTDSDGGKEMYSYKYNGLLSYRYGAQDERADTSLETISIDDTPPHPSLFNPPPGFEE